MLAKWGNKTHAKLKEVQSLVGVLSFAATCIKQGRAFFARILNFLRDMPYNGWTEIPAEVRKDIGWWKYVAPKFNGVSYIPVDFWSKPDSWISTDACLSYGGGYFNGEYLHFSFSDDLKNAAKFINQLELFIPWKVVELWGTKLR